jgi:hypothetical protein
MEKQTDASKAIVNDQFGKYSLLYQENVKIVAIFWEWRHKIITSFFAGLGGLSILAGWFYDHDKLRNLLFVPPLIGTILCFVCFFLDYRNGEILRKCYKVGENLEKDLKAEENAIFKSIGAKTYVSYTWTLRVTFVSVGVFLAYLTFQANRIAN